jgi:S-(hydroxymethyl)glutathione dehydrogenase/alcohol dehydrogenase
MKTKAAILRKLNEPLEIVELDIPRLQRGQVLVKIAYTAICQTQVNECLGHKGTDNYLPHTLGHEASGIVLEVGEGVTKVKEGDHVVASWIKGDGIDVASACYNHKNEKVNSGAISTFMEMAIIAENRLVVIPSNKISLKNAAILGCAIPTGAGVVFNEMNIKPGQSLVIFGAGGVGLSALVAGKYLKADPIIVVDVMDKKLEMAKKMGATVVINSAKENVADKVKNMDFAFECAGKISAMESAINSIKPFTGLAVIAGNVRIGEKLAIDPYDLIRGKRVIGTWGGKSAIDKDIVKYIDLIEKGYCNWSQFITHEISLEGINDLFDLMGSGGVGRGVISFIKDK